MASSGATLGNGITLNPTDANALQIVDTTGTNGRRVRIAPVGQASSSASSQLELVPGANVDSSTQCSAQMILYSKAGANYERFAFSAVNNQFIIDSTYNGTGQARNIYVQMGGSVAGPIPGRNAAIFYSDASVELPGGTYAADGKTWHVTRTKIGDAGNTGDSRLVIDTRTGTPGSNAADSAVVSYARGGSAKWSAGLNFAGGAVDSFDFWDHTNGAARLRLLQTGGLILSGGPGFWGHAPPASQPVTPTTLADVIAIVRGCGLAA